MNSQRPISSRKKIISWALYDWANSTFSTTVMAGFFPIFFKNFWSLGTEASVTTARLGTALSVGSFIMATLSPSLGVMADLRGRKKLFCGIFMLFGVISTAALTFIPSGSWVLAILAYSAGMMAFNASCVFYDSLLPSVAQESELDMVSSLGFSLGYLGGGILFAINVWMYLNPGFFGIKDGVTAVQISFLSVAIWWFVFSIPLFLNIPEPFVPANRDGLVKLTLRSVSKLKVTLLSATKNRNLFLFMMAFWLYIDGVYTVMTMAVDFGISIGFEAKDLIAALLITQFVGFPFAWLFGYLAPRFGCKKLILFCLFVYSVTLIFASRMSEVWHFYLLAATIGIVQGGVQSLSRSLFAKMVPPDQSGEFFGLFNLVGKFASILGPLIVAGGALMTDSRNSMLGLLVLFAIGSVLLWRIKEPKAAVLD